MDEYKNILAELKIAAPIDIAVDFLTGIIGGASGKPETFTKWLSRQKQILPPADYGSLWRTINEDSYLIGAIQKIGILPDFYSLSPETYFASLERKLKCAEGDIIIMQVPGKPGTVGVPGKPGTPTVPGKPSISGGGAGQPMSQPQQVVPQGMQLSPQEIQEIQMSGRDLPVSNKEQERVDNFTNGATPAVDVENNTPNSGNIPITQTKSVNKAFSEDMAVSPAGLKDSIGASNGYTDVDTSEVRYVPEDDKTLLQELNDDKQKNVNLAEDKGIDLGNLKEQVFSLSEQLGSTFSPLQLQGLIERTVNQTGSTEEALSTITQILKNRAN